MTSLLMIIEWELESLLLLFLLNSRSFFQFKYFPARMAEDFVLSVGTCCLENAGEGQFLFFRYKASFLIP